MDLDQGQSRVRENRTDEREEDMGSDENWDAGHDDNSRQWFKHPAKLAVSLGVWGRGGAALAGLVWSGWHSSESHSSKLAGGSRKA